MKIKQTPRFLIQHFDAAKYRTERLLELEEMALNRQGRYGDIIAWSNMTHEEQEDVRAQDALWRERIRVQWEGQLGPKGRLPPWYSP